MKVFSLIWLVALAYLLPVPHSQSQNIEWEVTFGDVGTERLVDAEFYDGDIFAIGNSSIGLDSAQFLRLDSIGNLKWVRDIFLRGLNQSEIYHLERVYDESNFYISGYISQSGVGNWSFIAKIDSAGDTLWVNTSNEQSFYNLTSSMVQLHDKSIISVGWRFTQTGRDVTAWKVDSTGQTLWKKYYTIGVSEGLDVTEMLDGSLIIAGRSDGDNLIMRIDFDGRLVHYLQQNMGATTFFVFGSLAFENEMLQTGIPNSASGTYQNLNIFEDSTYQLFQRLGLTTIKAYLDQDSNAVIRYFDGTNVRVRYTNSKILSNIWDIDLGPISGDFKSPIGFTSGEVNSASVIAYGYSDISNNQNYWLAKISGVGEGWIPDRCTYQPPGAGFDYEYNYPVLTLRDTSSGGLKYLDTVYTWQWNTSIGTNGTDDSLVVFFDTAINSSIVVDLIISNWYGCTDTLTKTLVMGETGLEVYKELEVKVFPNPVKDILNVHIDDIQDRVLFSLYDLQGRLQFNQVLESDKTTISLSGLPQGLYIYDIRTNVQVIPIANGRGKIIKN